MNRPLFKPNLKTFSIHHRVATEKLTQDKVQANAPWWQLYSALLVLLGGGIVMAVNAPAVLHNRLVLVAAVGGFFGFVFMWLHRNARKIEAEPWSLSLGVDEDTSQSP